MAFKIVDAGSVTRTVSTMKVLEGSTLRRILRMKVVDTDGVTLRTVATFAPPLSLSAPATAANYAYGSGATTTSVAATATPSGGLGPYTYSWAALAATDITIVSPTAATTYFSYTSIPPDSATTTFRCTCTDSAGQTATADCEVALAVLTSPGG